MLVLLVFYLTLLWVEKLAFVDKAYGWSILYIYKFTFVLKLLGRGMVEN